MSIAIPIPPGNRTSGPYTASAGQATLAGTFHLQRDTDLAVIRVRAGVETTLALGTQYTVAGVGAASGFTVMLSPAALADDLYTLKGQAVIDRLTSVVQAGKFSAKQTDSEFDRDRIIAQEQARDIAAGFGTLEDRALRVPTDETIAQLPAAASRANKFLAFSAAGAIALTALDLGAGLTISTAASRVVLAALASSAAIAFLDEGPRAGFFVWRSGDLAAQVAADPDQGLYVAPASDPTGASGAWARHYSGTVRPQMWGAAGDGVTGDDAAITAALASGIPVSVDSAHGIAGNLTLTTGSLIFQRGALRPAAGIVVTLQNVWIGNTGGGIIYDTSAGGSFAFNAADVRNIRGLKISDYLSDARMTIAQDGAIAAALKDLFNLNFYSLDLEGRRITLDAPLDMAAITGLTSKAVWKCIANGEIDPSASFPAVATVTKTADCDMTAGSAIVTGITSTADLLPWMEVSGTGIPRSTFIKSVDSGTQITMTRFAMSTGANRTVVCKRHRFIFDFTGFTSLNRLTFENVHLLLGETASGYLGSQNDDIIEFRKCKIVRPETYGICQPDAGGGLVVDGGDLLTNDAAIVPTDRTRIAIACNGDCRIVGNRMAYFRHALIVRGGAATVIGNHPFSGFPSAGASAHLAGMIFQQASRHTIVGNYIDNGWLEFTNESFAYNPAAEIGGATIVGNQFTTLADAATELLIVVAPYVANSTFRNMNISGNFFKPQIGGPAVVLDKATGYDATNGSVDNTTIESLFMRDNLFENVTTRQENPATAKFQSLTPWGHTTGGADFTGKMPFGINPLGLALAVMVKGANDIGAVRVTGRTGGTINLAWPTATAVDTDIIVTATCNNDPMT